MGDQSQFDVAIVGAGLAGLSAALALEPICAAAGVKIALVAPVSQNIDPRTTALMMPSVELMQEMGFWDVLVPHSAQLATIRIIDGTKRLIRSPLTEFKAAELSLEAFGYNVPNSLMVEKFENKIAASDTIIRFDAMLGSADCRDGGVDLTLSTGEKITCKLVGAADGKNSILRDAAAIETQKWSYPQSAFVVNFQHTLPHNSVSTEFHTETGPFTQVPLPAVDGAPLRSSLVWMVTPEQAEDLRSKLLEELNQLIEMKMQSFLGKIVLETQPQTFPISGMIAKTFAANGVFLLGESSHVFPPIGAQGFNLGLRDVADFRDCIQKLHLSDAIIDSAAACETFDQMRRRDVLLSTGAVDLLNRTLLSDFLPVQAVRSLGLSALGNFSWLRRQMMQRGMGRQNTSYRDGNKSGGKSPVVMR